MGAFQARLNAPFIVIEFLGVPKPDGNTREHLGFEIVDVKRETTPATLATNIGDFIRPIDNDLSLLAQPLSTSTVGQRPFLFQHISDEGSLIRFYAVRENDIPSQVLVYWLEKGILGLFWPKFFHGYLLRWPGSLSEFSLNALNLVSEDPAAAAVTLSDNIPSLQYQDDPSADEAEIDALQRFVVNFDEAGDGFNRALIRYQKADEIWFERIWSQDFSALTDLQADLDGDGSPDLRPTLSDRDADGSVDNTFTVSVGERIVPPFEELLPSGYIVVEEGDAYNADAYRDPFSEGFDVAESGAIIPVNALPANDSLVIWWFSRTEPPADTTEFVATVWPSLVATYSIEWPADPREIVMASNEGSGELSTLEAIGSIYVQNDDSLPGNNPNDEHALMLGGRAYALRDDLNTETSSDPYVLIEYTEEDGRPAMSVFSVLRENEEFSFEYDAVSGTILQAVMPLPFLPLPIDANGNNRNREVTPSGQDPAVDFGQADPDQQIRYGHYDEFTFEDRKHITWIYRGPHDPGSVDPENPPKLEFQYYYKTQEGFYFPEESTQPALGTIVPLLRPLVDPQDPSQGFTGDPVTGTSLTINFIPVWPEFVPELRFGETLTLPKFGLPAIRGQTSAEILYQQSIAAGLPEERQSATLYDPTRPKKFRFVLDGSLNEIPGSIATTASRGKTFFQNAPPQLRERFFFDPNEGTDGALVLMGEFVEDLGEDYLLLNVLSSTEMDDLKALADDTDAKKTDWEDAIDNLSTTLETFVEDESVPGTFIPDPNQDQDIEPDQLAAIDDDDIAVDSYALAAANVPSLGDLPADIGLVTIITGNGEAFTPGGEPVSLHIFKVVDTLGKGELKVILSPNPLDEKVTVRHSADFAARPEDYEFEWIYSPPVNGLAPALFRITSELLVSDGIWDSVRNPIVDLPDDSDFLPGNIVALPQAIVIHDGGQSPDRPGLVLKRTFDVVDAPLQIFLSLDMGDLDGFVLFLNQVEILAFQAPNRESALRTTPPSAVTNTLQNVFEIDTESIDPDNTNTLALALFTQEADNTSNTFHARLHNVFEEDLSGNWIPLDPAADPSGATVADNLGRDRHTIQGASILTLSDNYLAMRYRARNPEDTSGDMVIDELDHPHPTFRDDDADDFNDNWSRWTDAQLVEGWIKRVLGGINPFNQRVTDLFNNQINTDVSILTQAGERWEGDVALSLENIDEFGLIAIYETVLNRGKKLSIDGTPSIDFGPANDALLLASGYLNDLYMQLGNEGFADAANPTIAFDTQSGEFGNVATALFAFKGQVTSLLEEELILLRGRDDFLSPGVEISPVYNRAFWNYTRGIDDGELVYSLNYNIREKHGEDADGVIDAEDARRMFPQGHGDTYGHYLTAIKNYYRLLGDANFTWAPRVEAVLVLGKAVQVDFLDERKFASAASAAARTAQQILELVHRQVYTEDLNAGWSHLRDARFNSQTGRTRRWGADSWASRGTQGAFYNWVVGNALLPEEDTVNEGILRIDRSTVPELGDLARAGEFFQVTLDNINVRINPLGLSPNSVSFDLSPSAWNEGETHFEQIFERALDALQNALTAFNRAAEETRFLRTQEGSLNDFQAAVFDEERAFKNKLIDTYGTALPGDIGPGKLYPSGFDGPDTLKFMWIEQPSRFFPQNPDSTATLTMNLNRPNTLFDIENFNSILDQFFGAQTQDEMDSVLELEIPNQAVSPTEAVVATVGDFLSSVISEDLFSGDFDGIDIDDARLLFDTVDIFDLQNSFFDLVFDPSLTSTVELEVNFDDSVQFAALEDGRRATPGQIQQSLLKIVMTRHRLLQAMDEFEDRKRLLNGQVFAINEAVKAFLLASQAQINTAEALEVKERTLRALNNAIKLISKIQGAITDFQLRATIEGVPKALGFSNDTTFPIRAAATIAAGISTTIGNISVITLEVQTGIVRKDMRDLRRNLDKELLRLGFGPEKERMLFELGQAFDDFIDTTFETDTAFQEVSSAQMEFEHLAALGLRLQEERGIFRKRAAAIIQGFRVRDLAFRVFRNEALEQYKTLFDLAARYGYLAAKAYDYEAGLLGTHEGSDFLNEFVASRALGVIENGRPQFAGSQTGDPGLSGLLAKLEGDFSIVESRLGFNNPDTYGTTFSLRREFFRILETADGDEAWREVLESHIVDNLLEEEDFATFALAGGDPDGLPVPGILIAFGTEINDGKNLFGLPIASGDSFFSPSSFATKIFSSGVVFEGYRGMNLDGILGDGSGGDLPGTDDLSATPYLYLLPTGSDFMRAPPLGDTGAIRTWSVFDQALPLPFNIGDVGFSTPEFFRSADSLTEEFLIARKHQAFRAVDDEIFFFNQLVNNDDFTNRRLIGRSVWNSRWKLAIPARTLLADEEEGLDRFIRTVRDIKIYFRTYSFAGN